MACQYFPDGQTLQLQTGAEEDDVIHFPSDLDHVDCERQEEEEESMASEAQPPRVQQQAGLPCVRMVEYNLTQAHLKTAFTSRQSNSTHYLLTENRTLPAPLPPPQTEQFSFRKMPMRQRSSNPQPYPTVPPHAKRSEKPDMAQSIGYLHEVLRTGREAAADYRLHPSYDSKNLVWLGTRRKKNKENKK